jgi:hypothetical protein
MAMMRRLRLTFEGSGAKNLPKKLQTKKIYVVVWF